jgi:hypothetical protein
MYGKDVVPRYFDDKVYIFCDSFVNSGSRSSLVVLLSVIIGDSNFSLTADEDIIVDRERVSQAGWIAEEALLRGVVRNLNRLEVRCDDLIRSDVILPPALYTMEMRTRKHCPRLDLE